MSEQLQFTDTEEQVQAAYDGDPSPHFAELLNYAEEQKAQGEQLDPKLEEYLLAASAAVDVHENKTAGFSHPLTGETRPGTATQEYSYFTTDDDNQEVSLPLNREVGERLRAFGNQTRHLEAVNTETEPAVEASEEKPATVAEPKETAKTTESTPLESTDTEKSTTAERKHPKRSTKRDAIADLVQLDTNGRARYSSGVKLDEKGNAIGSIKGRIMSKHEVDTIEAHQDLIRNGVGEYHRANEKAAEAEKRAAPFRRQRRMNQVTIKAATAMLTERQKPAATPATNEEPEPTLKTKVFGALRKVGGLLRNGFKSKEAEQDTEISPAVQPIEESEEVKQFYGGEITDESADEIAELLEAVQLTPEDLPEIDAVYDRYDSYGLEPGDEFDLARLFNELKADDKNFGLTQDQVREIFLDQVNQGVLVATSDRNVFRVAGASETEPAAETSEEEDQDDELSDKEIFLEEIEKDLAADAEWLVSRNSDVFKNKRTLRERLTRTGKDGFATDEEIDARIDSLLEQYDKDIEKEAQKAVRTSRVRKLAKLALDKIDGVK